MTVGWTKRGELIEFKAPPRLLFPLAAVMVCAHAATADMGTIRCASGHTQIAVYRSVGGANESKGAVGWLRIPWNLVLRQGQDRRRAAWGKAGVVPPHCFQQEEW